VIIDTEHGPSDSVERLHHLRTADSMGIGALVRVPANGPEAILAALDAGALGVVVPHVMSAVEAEAAVQSAHYPLRGRRGLALSTRAGYGSVPLADHLDEAATSTLVIAQIEDGPAVAACEEITAVEGIDGILIGTTDLSISLGHPEPRSIPT
jgi:4-hydroxy-2-oxoheptanedioate aldolase